MNLQNFVPPAFDDARLQAFARDKYGIAGSWSRLEGERDQNFRVVEPGGANWTLKVCNPHEPADSILCQALALEHIARTDPALPVPRLRRDISGDIAPVLLDDQGHAHLTLALSYLSGNVLGNVSIAPERLRQLGSLVARLGRALRGFVHAAPAARPLIWDNRRAADLLDHVHLLPEENRALARAVLGDFRDNTLPRLEFLRSQIIHGDVHPWNVLADQSGAISGIIDFGDLVHAVLVQDLANLIADFLESGQDPEPILLSLIGGYREVTPLEEDELGVLLDLVEVRLVMTPIITALRASNSIPAEGYLQSFGSRSFKVVEALRAKRSEFETLVRRAAAFPPKKSTTAEKLPEMLTRRHAVMGEKLYLFYDPPLHMVRGEGVWLHDSTGRRYLDCYNNVPHVGHCHPYVAEAIARQARTLNTNTRYVTDEAIAYAERLVATAHPSLSAVLYVNSGSEANDVAWRLAKAWTGKSGGLAMDFAYHGITDAIDCFSPSNAPDAPLAPHIRVIPPPDDYRGPYRRGEPDLAQRYAALADPPIRDLDEHGYGVTAVMIDSAFMTNGMLDAPKGYLQAVCGKVRAAGGLFIADEVQSGFGRMGTAMWGHQHHGVVPDFITIGKPAGNGHPIGVVLTRPEILEHFTKSTAFFSTFGGNNVSCAAGLAVLDVIRDENLIENARSTGEYLRQGLLNLKGRHGLIGDVRGVGLAVGMELVRDHSTREPATAEIKRLLSLVRDEGVLVGGEGRLSNIIKIRPPVVLNRGQADMAIAAIDRAFARL